MIYITVLIFFFIIELIYFKFADLFNIIDKPNERSSHKQITILGGGVLFYFAVVLYSFLNGILYPWFLIGMTLIAIISFVDDIRPQSYKVRLAIHLMSILLLFYQIGMYELPWYYFPIALVISVGILNAYNFMDGINGMIGIYTIVVLGSLWYINLFYLNFVDGQIIYYLMLALIVFNFFNFRRNAKCFAGDVGALSLAFVVVFLVGFLILKSEDFKWIGLLSVFGVDTILTIIHRLILKENIFVAHRKHLFQLFANELKYSHLIVSVSYAVIQIVISIGLIVFENYGFWYLSCVISLLSLIYYLLKKKYFHLHQQNIKSNL
ncbi:MAG: glycosyltransferase family 4 protein [Paludibacter sp.]|nr:glycosyltransferase family 4 protein [Paludibacter sp.]